MTNTKTQSLGDAIVSFLREEGLEQSVYEVQAEGLWAQLMGETVAKLTRSVEVKNGVLIVHVSSAALKAQLFENRFELVQKMNDTLGAKAIRDCRILG